MSAAVYWGWDLSKQHDTPEEARAHYERLLATPVPGSHWGRKVTLVIDGERTEGTRPRL